MQATNMGSEIRNVVINNNVSQLNTGSGSAHGFLIFGQDNGVVDGLNMYGNTSLSNQSRGLYVVARTGGSVLGVSVYQNTFRLNAIGVQIDDDANVIEIDYGGGALGSIGQNVSFDNTLADIHVDLDGGELKAENNWWGSASGLDPSDVTLDDASTIDVDPFLTSDPND